MKVPKPRKKVLSEKNRETLRALARRKVQADPATEKALAKAKAKHDEMFDEVGALLKAKIEGMSNAEDMAVLVKYGMTDAMSSTRVQLKKMSEDAAEKGTSGGFFHWRFKDADRPAVPRWRYPDDLKWEDRDEWKRNNVPDYNNVLLGGADEKKYLKYGEAAEALSLAEANREQSRRDLLQDYMALILSARTYEDVLEVWPEASEVRNDIVPGACTAITAFSQDAAERIKADFARRQKLQSSE